MKPPQVGISLSATELQGDVVRAGVEGDQSTHRDEDPHFPASDAQLVQGKPKARPMIERDLTNLPPG